MHSGRLRRPRLCLVDVVLGQVEEHVADVEVLLGRGLVEAHPAVAGKGGNLVAGKMGGNNNK